MPGVLMMVRMLVSAQTIESVIAHQGRRRPPKKVIVQGPLALAETRPKGRDGDDVGDDDGEVDPAKSHFHSRGAVMSGRRLRSGRP